jgi:hypothetical protein
VKVLRLPVVLEGTSRLGWLVSAAVPLGIIALVCTGLYLFPRPNLLGAVLLTGYFSGTVTTHLRIGSPLFSHTLFGVYLGVPARGALPPRRSAAFAVPVAGQKGRVIGPVSTTKGK